MVKEITENINMNQQIDPQILARLKLVWPFLKNVLVKAGISFAMVAAAVHLVPDQAVMSKEEIESGKPLDEKEMFIRKAAIPGIILAGCAIPKQVSQIFMLSRYPGIQAKLLALSKVLIMTPAFIMAYQILKRKIEDREPTLNIREIMKDSPIGPKTMGAVSTAGLALQGGTLGVGAALSDIAAAKATQA